MKDLLFILELAQCPKKIKTKQRYSFTKIYTLLLVPAA
jgi:hypothetical protein